MKRIPEKSNGRNTKLTPELISAFADWIRKGNTIKTACALCRVHTTTFHAWMRAGEAEHSPETVDFYNAILAADAEHEASVVEQWQKINAKMTAGKTKTDWRSQQALLTYRHKWSPPPTQTQSHVTTDINVNVAPDLSKLTDVELQSLAELLQKTAPQIESGPTIDVVPEEVE